MTKGWQPKDFEEACRRNAGRRKLHARKREERANRIGLLLQLMETDAGVSLKENTYGWLSVVSKQWSISAATASRDLALSRQIRLQFLRMFGREFNSTKDKVVWSWDWSHYGFKTRESVLAGYKKSVGKFPFNTRSWVVEEDAYCGFNPSSWQKATSSNEDRHNHRSDSSPIQLLTRLRL